GFALVLGALATAGPAAIRTASVALLLVGFGIGAAKMLDDENRRAPIADVTRYLQPAGGPPPPGGGLPQVPPRPEDAAGGGPGAEGQGAARRSAGLRARAAEHGGPAGAQPRGQVLQPGRPARASRRDCGPGGSRGRRWPAVRRRPDGLPPIAASHPRPALR